MNALFPSPMSIDQIAQRKLPKLFFTGVDCIADLPTEAARAKAMAAWTENAKRRAERADILAAREKVSAIKREDKSRQREQAKARRKEERDAANLYAKASDA